MYIHSVELVTQLCRYCNPTDGSLTGFSGHGILQARILEWVAILFSRGSPNPGIEPRSPTLQADSLLSELQRSPVALPSELQGGTIYMYMYIYTHM